MRDPLLLTELETGKPDPYEADVMLDHLARMERDGLLDAQQQRRLELQRQHRNGIFDLIGHQTQ